MREELRQNKLIRWFPMMRALAVLVSGQSKTLSTPSCISPTPVTLKNGWTAQEWEDPLIHRPKVIPLFDPPSQDADSQSDNDTFGDQARTDLEHAKPHR